MISEIIEKLKLAAVCICFSSLALADNWPSQSTPEFDALLEAARAEGEVVVIGDPVLGNELAAAFEADTGIAFRLIGAGPAEVVPRFFQEVGANAASFDVMLSGPQPLRLSSRDNIQPIAPHLHLPEITDGSNWRGGALVYLDSENQYLPTPSNYVVGGILVNTSMVDPSSLSVWSDLLRDDLQGQIISHDVTFPGLGQNIASFLYGNLGAEYAAALYVGQEVSRTGDYRAIADSVARGTYAIGLGAAPRFVTRYQEEGLDFLEMVNLSDNPGFLIGGQSVMVVPTSAAHPNAAMVFANWYLSQRGQEVYANALSVPSDRLDVVDGNWPDFVAPQPGVEYPNIYVEEWQLGAHRANTEAIKELVAE